VNGASLWQHVAGTASSVASAVLPLAACFILFQLLFLKLPRTEVMRILTGTALAAFGLFLFLVGVGIGFMPFGRAVGEALGSLQAKWLLLPFGALLGFVTTWGEPAVRVLADQVEQASSGSIRRLLVVTCVCTGVAVAVGLGMLRIGYEVPLLWFLVPGYGIVLCMMWLSETQFVSIAIDAGGVATGPLANTFLLALALGASSAMGGQNPLVHGLGLVALIALAPVISVMVLGVLMRCKERRSE
jgi:hypothetical protein